MTKNQKIEAKTNSLLMQLAVNQPVVFSAQYTDFSTRQKTLSQISNLQKSSQYQLTQDILLEIKNFILDVDLTAKYDRSINSIMKYSILLNYSFM